MIWLILLFFLGPAVYVLIGGAVYGPGISPDTVAYFSMAQHVAAGKGISAYYSLYSDVSGPIAAWPPFYPLILSAGVLLKAPFLFGQIVNALLFGFNAASAVYMVSRFSGSRVAAVGAGLLFWFHPTFSEYHFWLISEPLFVALILWSVFGLSRYLESGERRFLALSIVMTGLIPLVRYIGLSYLLSGSATLLLLSKGDWRRRFLKASIYGILSAVPLMVWLARNFVVMERYARAREELGYRLFGSLVEHTGVPNSLTQNVVYASRGVGEWASHSSGVSGWPEGTSGILLLAGFIGVTGGICLSFVPQKNANGGTQARIFLVSHAVGAVFYFGIFVFSLCFSKFTGDFGDRYLIPVFVHGVLAAGCGWGLVLRVSWRSASFAKIAVALGLAAYAGMIFLLAADAVRQIERFRREGPDGTRGALVDRTRQIAWFPTEESTLQYHKSNQLLGRWR